MGVARGGVCGKCNQNVGIFRTGRKQQHLMGYGRRSYKSKGKVTKTGNGALCNGGLAVRSEQDTQ